MNNGSPSNIVAIIMKNYTSSDFIISYQSPIELYFPKDVIISKIRTKIIDNTFQDPVNIGTNSSIIYSITNSNPSIEKKYPSIEDIQNQDYQLMDMVNEQIKANVNKTGALVNANKIVTQADKNKKSKTERDAYQKEMLPGEDSPNIKKKNFDALAERLSIVNGGGAKYKNKLLKEEELRVAEELKRQEEAKRALQAAKRNSVLKDLYQFNKITPGSGLKFKTDASKLRNEILGGGSENSFINKSDPDVNRILGLDDIEAGLNRGKYPLERTFNNLESGLNNYTPADIDQFGKDVDFNRLDRTGALMRLAAKNDGTVDHNVKQVFDKIAGGGVGGLGHSETDVNRFFDTGKYFFSPRGKDQRAMYNNIDSPLSKFGEGVGPTVGYSVTGGSLAGLNMARSAVKHLKEKEASPILDLVKAHMLKGSNRPIVDFGQALVESSNPLRHMSDDLANYTKGEYDVKKKRQGFVDDAAKKIEVRRDEADKYIDDNIKTILGKPGYKSWTYDRAETYYQKEYLRELLPEFDPTDDEAKEAFKSK